MRKAILACLVLFLGSILLPAQQALDNASVIKLIKAGLSDDLVVTTINSSAGAYDTSANGLIALKKAGASDKILAAIVLKAAGAAAPAPVAAVPAEAATPSSSPVLPQGALPAGVDTVGVYFLDESGTHWQEVPAEVVNFKSGGALKHYASAGLLKGEMAGLVGGNHSPLTLKLPAKFILYIPEGRAPGEYQLIHLQENADSRVFQAANGGIVRDAGGALRDVMDYTPKKIAPHVYLVEMTEDFDKGEYGFLPPADIPLGNSIPTATKIYSFSLIR
jgi:hypothetical protein